MANPDELLLDWLKVDPVGLDTFERENLGLKEFDAQFFPSVAGFKVWLAGQWVAKPVKVWDGSAWVVKPLKRWNSTAWV